MRYFHVIVFAVMLGFTSPTFSATSPEPSGKNAAVGYLMAIGWMTPPSEQVLNQIDRADSLESLKSFTSETWHYFSDSRMPIVLRFLKQGADCDFCRYIYERTYLPDDLVPPYRRLRDLAKIARGAGLKMLKEGNASEAFEIFKAVFRMGEGLEQDETLLSGHISVLIRKEIVKPFEEVITTASDSSVIEMVREYLRSLPKTTTGYKNLLEYERRYIENSLKFMKSHPETVDDFQILTPSNSDKNKITLSESPLSKCQANQRVLQGALELLTLDFNPLPASMTPAIIPEYLVHSGYLKEFPVCPQRGRYEVFTSSDGSLSFHCTIHPEPDYKAIQKNLQDQAQAEKEKLRTFVNTPEFDALCMETLAFMDEAIAMDQNVPDFIAKLDAFTKKVEASPNALVRKMIPSFRKLYQHRLELDESIQNLAKK